MWVLMLVLPVAVCSPDTACPTPPSLRMLKGKAWASPVTKRLREVPRVDWQGGDCAEAAVQRRLEKGLPVVVTNTQLAGFGVPRWANTDYLAAAWPRNETLPITQTTKVRCR